jgi:hypothetical protein
MERHRVSLAMGRIMGVTTAIVALIVHNALQDPGLVPGGLAHGRLGQQARSSYEVMSLLVPAVVGALARLQRQRMEPRAGGRAADFSDKKGVGDFSDGSFKQFFRFRPTQFYEFMFHLGLAYAGPGNGVVFTEVEFGERWARGRPNADGEVHYRRIERASSDWVMMVLLYRLSTHSRQVDVQMICGGRSQPSISRAERWALDFLYERYGGRISDLGHFRDQFGKFADYFKTTNSPIQGLMATTDGHFQEVCRPGGLGNVFGNLLDQRELYNGHYKAHGLKWCCLLLPNGMTCVAGPYPGRETDITCLRKSGFLEVLREYRDSTGIHLCIFGDAAYGCGNPFIMATIKNPRGGVMSADERSYNAFTSRLRIPIEQVFGNSDQKFGFISNRKNLKVNLQSVGKYFKMAMFVFNCLSLSQGNQAMTQSGFNKTLRLSVREYMKI